MTIRNITEADYDNILVGWWNSWAFQPPVKDFLPKMGDDFSGFIIEGEDGPLCAGFFYLTNSPVGWVEWVVSNPNKSKERNQALNILIETLTNTLVESGCKFAYATMKHPSLISRYEAMGYTQGDSNSTEMIKAL